MVGFPGESPVLVRISPRETKILAESSKPGSMQDLSSKSSYSIAYAAFRTRPAAGCDLRRFKEADSLPSVAHDASRDCGFLLALLANSAQAGSASSTCVCPSALSHTSDGNLNVAIGTGLHDRKFTKLPPTLLPFQKQDPDRCHAYCHLQWNCVKSH
jgi:hypothetical protein